MTITLASFYIHRPNHPMSRSYDKMLDLQKRSCEKWGIDHIVLTDFGSNLNYNTFESDLPDNLMEASLVAQRQYLWNGSFDNLILCDADVVLGKDPRPIFDDVFDIGITVHPFVDSILNNGAIFVKNHSVSHTNWVVATFWTDAISIFKKQSSGVQQWGGDQQALRDSFEASLELGMRSLDGVAVRQFPCEGYNEAPDNVNHDIRPYCVHFRGTRKEWAEEWTKTFLQL